MATPLEGHPPAVVTRGLSRRFGWTWALRDVDLSVDPGELVTIMGPNGAGKSTLLRVLATLLRPTEGEVRVAGHDPRSSTDEVRRALGFLAPGGYLYDQLTALENLRFACLMSGVEADDARLRKLLERMGLDRAAEVRVGGYSSGMRRRLALARLLLRPLEVALLDEPWASLDLDGVELVDDVVGEMRADGTTVLLATHQWDRVRELVDRVVVLERGSVARSGPPEAWDERGASPLHAGDPPEPSRGG